MIEVRYELVSANDAEDSEIGLAIPSRDEGAN